MSSDNVNKSSLGSGFSDQSHLTGDTGTSLVGGESMSGGNTVAQPATSIGAAPGSSPVNQPLGGPENKTDVPSLETGSPKSYTRRP